MQRSICNQIQDLVEYAQRCGLIEPTDRMFMINRVMEELKVAAFEPPEGPDGTRPLEEILKGLCDYAIENAIIPDCGITGRDLAADSGADVTELMPLEFGRSRFCFAAPKELELTSVKELDGKRIACSYPQLLKSKLNELGLECPVVRLDGAVELSVKLGIADAVADVVESGSTLKEAAEKWNFCDKSHLARLLKKYE